MSEPTSESPDRSRSRSRGTGGWLTDPNRGWLLPLSGFWILVLDWLLFSSNAVSGGLATPIVAMMGFLLGAAGTFFLQRRRAGDKAWKATLKALLAGVAVGVPWPLAGTLAGGWVLLVSGIRKSRLRPGD